MCKYKIILVFEINTFCDLKHLQLQAQLMPFGQQRKLRE